MSVEMSSLSSSIFAQPVQKEFLIVVFDLLNYTRFSRESDARTVFHTLNEFYKISKKHIEDSDGILIKFIGDAGLAIFDVEKADRGIMAMLELKKKIDLWCKSGKIKNGNLSVNCHVGEAMVGYMNGPNSQNLDVIGEAVNICFTLGKKQFLISPQAFRSLKAESRKAFKKYTPPIVYRLA